MKISDMAGRGREATMDLEELPDEFEGLLTNEELKKDAYEKECLYWELEVDSGLVVQKFAPLHLKYLSDALTKLGVKDTSELIGSKMLFEKVEMSIGKPRWIPKKIVKQKSL